ncbi:MAG: hypothetical protein SFT81_04800 [Candidatus Caenarcaniphilales bacterium]|nr:hypothetical protein [Candidatus Caenarcaniphilales bacterium]
MCFGLLMSCPSTKAIDPVNMTDWTKVESHNGVEIFARSYTKFFARYQPATCYELRIMNNTDKQAFGGFEIEADFGGQETMLVNYYSFGPFGIKPGKYVQGDPARGYSPLYQCFKDSPNKLKSLMLRKLFIVADCGRKEVPEPRAILTFN